ncbi:hypothetical protein [Palleronia marisminoris]|uniref:hypothetical protein n=1 Tax=Palleronia marisminoris TaxID=315423 RepID=UPI000A271D7A|nr:hypothetical protein [Palleronia marisminoris]
MSRLSVVAHYGAQHADPEVDSVRLRFRLLRELSADWFLAETEQGRAAGSFEQAFDLSVGDIVA